MRIFVYGSLMTGFWNYERLLKGKVKSVTSAEMEGLLYHLPAGFPGVTEGEGIVKGELMELDDEGILQRLDSLEGYVPGSNNNLYTRVRKKVKLKNGETQFCWVYLYEDKDYLHEKGILIEDGDWRKYLQERG